MENENLDEQVENIIDESIEVEETEVENADDFHDEDIVYIDGDTPPEQDEENEESRSAPNWIKELRAHTKKQSKKIFLLEEELAKVKAPQSVAPIAQVSHKPKIEDFDYDTELYEGAMDAWYNEQQIVRQQELIRQKDTEKQQQEATSIMKRYSDNKQKLRVPDYDLAEEKIRESFNIDQQNIMLKFANDSALLIYAIGKNKAKIDELSSIKDPILFALTMSEFEKKLKVEKRRPSTSPERVIVGSGAKLSNDMHLDALRREAAKTGDYTKVYKYKKQTK